MTKRFTDLSEAMRGTEDRLTVYQNETIGFFLATYNNKFENNPAFHGLGRHVSTAMEMLQQHLTSDSSYKTMQENMNDIISPDVKGYAKHADNLDLWVQKESKNQYLMALFNGESNEFEFNAKEMRFAFPFEGANPFEADELKVLGIGEDLDAAYASIDKYMHEYLFKPVIPDE